MPVKSEKGLKLVAKEVYPSPAEHNVQRPFGQKRPSRMTTHPDKYQAWQNMLDSSHSAQQARLARHSVLAAGACVGSLFKGGQDGGQSL